MQRVVDQHCRLRRHIHIVVPRPQMSRRTLCDANSSSRSVSAFRGGRGWTGIQVSLLCDLWEHARQGDRDAPPPWPLLCFFRDVANSPSSSPHSRRLFTVALVSRRSFSGSPPGLFAISAGLMRKKNVPVSFLGARVLECPVVFLPDFLSLCDFGRLLDSRLWLSSSREVTSR